MPVWKSISARRVPRARRRRRDVVSATTYDGAEHLPSTQPCHPRHRVYHARGSRLRLLAHSASLVDFHTDSCPRCHEGSWRRLGRARRLRGSVRERSSCQRLAVGSTIDARAASGKAVDRRAERRRRAPHKIRKSKLYGITCIFFRVPRNAAGGGRSSQARRIDSARPPS